MRLMDQLYIIYIYILLNLSIYKLYIIYHTFLNFKTINRVDGWEGEGKGSQSQNEANL